MLMLLASFWTMHLGGTWPPISVVFLVAVALILLTSLRKHFKEKELANELMLQYLELRKQGFEQMESEIDSPHLDLNEDFHIHVDQQGIFHKCYHACKNQNLFFSKMYWVSLTFAFPIEHIVYHKLWPFYLLSNLLNIS